MGYGEHPRKATMVRDDVHYIFTGYETREADGDLVDSTRQVKPLGQHRSTSQVGHLDQGILLVCAEDVTVEPIECGVRVKFMKHAGGVWV